MSSAPGNEIRLDLPMPNETAGVGKRAWRALAVLTAVYALHYLDRSIIGILIEPIKHEFALSDTRLGILTGLGYSILYASAGLAIGAFIDRTHRRNLLAVLLFFWSSATMLCGFAQGFLSLMLARCAVGVAESGAAPIAMSIITDTFPPKRRSTAIGLFWTSTTFGLAAAAIGGGYIASRFGWRAAFLIAGIPGILLIPILLTWVREPLRGGLDAATTNPARQQSLSTAWRALGRNPVYIYVFVAMIFSSAASSGLLIWIPSLFVRAHGLSLYQAGLILAAAALTAGTLGAFVGGAIGDRLTQRLGLAGMTVTAMFSALLACLTASLAVLSAALWLAAASWMAWEFCYRAYFGPANNAMLSSVEPDMRGIAASAAQSITNLLGFGLGPTIVGVLSDNLQGPHALQWAMAILQINALIAALMFFLAVRAARRIGNPTHAAARSDPP
jgi:predicted MFS family arabinose efflux permease